MYVTSVQENFPHLPLPIAERFLRSVGHSVGSLLDKICFSTEQVPLDMCSVRNPAGIRLK
jgi:hypothetical protein